MISELTTFRDEQLKRKPSDRMLAKVATVSPSTIGAWLRGDSFPQRIDQMLKLLQAVRGQAEAAGLIHNAEVATLLDSDRWRRAHKVEALRRAEGTRTAVQAQQGRAVLERMQPGRPLEEVSDPFQLEVHHAIKAEGKTAGLPALPVYVPRDHDRPLNAVVEQAATGTSRIAVLVGGSSTGKTRACWEALQLLREHPGWRLWHPIDPTRLDAALADLAHVGPHTVVWLNEAQFYLDGLLGERVASGLRELLRDPRRAPVLVLATLWPAHWNTLTTRTDPDLHAQARELLDGHNIQVPDAFTGPDLKTLTDMATRDPRLTEAAKRAPNGQVTQYLAGVPVLMDRYQQAPPATKALIHAAMDARRLGCGPRLPLALLSEAAPGYLTEAQSEQTGEDWLQQALTYTTVACNGIPGILTPVKTDAARNRRTSSQTRAEHGPLYRLADYLDQHGRRHRDDQIPPISFWTAAAHARPDDLTALGISASTRGLYRDAAQLYKHAASHGDPYAAAALIKNLHHLHPTDQRPAHWAVAHVAFDDLPALGQLLETLREVGAYEQMATLLARSPATNVVLDKPNEVRQLLRSLKKIGEHEQMIVLAERAAAHAPLDDPEEVGELLHSLKLLGAYEQIIVLAERAVTHAPLDDPNGVAWMLRKLEEVEAYEQTVALVTRNPAAQVALDDPNGVGWLLHFLWTLGVYEQVTVLAERVAAHAILDDPEAVGDLLYVLQEVGAHEQVTVLAERAIAHAALDDPKEMWLFLQSLREVEAHEQVAALAERAVAHAALDDPEAITQLLRILRDAEAHEQVAMLLARSPGTSTAYGDPNVTGESLRDLREARTYDQVAALLARGLAVPIPLEDPVTVMELLHALQQAGAHKQFALLSEQASAHVALDDTGAIARLLHVLRDAGEHEQVGVLLARNPAAHATLDSPDAVAELLHVLREARANEQIAILAERLPAEGWIGQFIANFDHRKLFRFGREPDKSAAVPWAWDDLA